MRSTSRRPSTPALPGRVLRDLGIEPTGKREFVLADGRRMDICRVWATIDGDSEVTQVAFAMTTPHPRGAATRWRGWALRWTPRPRGSSPRFC